jgi:hypothetical protein
MQNHPPSVDLTIRRPDERIVPFAPTLFVDAIAAALRAEQGFEW